MMLFTSLLAFLSVSHAAPQGPDLALTAVSVSSYGDDLTAIVQVTNLGDEYAPEFRVDVFGNTSFLPKLGDKGDDSSVVYGLKPGQSETVKLGMTTLSPESDGYANLWVLVDQLDAVVESNEENNGAQMAAPNKVVQQKRWGDLGWAFTPAAPLCKGLGCDGFTARRVCFDVVRSGKVVDATWQIWEPTPEPMEPTPEPMEPTPEPMEPTLEPMELVWPGEPTPEPMRLVHRKVCGKALDW